MKCSCIEEMNAKLKEHNVRLKTSLFLSGRYAGQARIAVSTIWIETPKSGRGRTRKEPMQIILSHCPFCQIKLDDDDDEPEKERRQSLRVRGKWSQRNMRRWMR